MSETDSIRRMEQGIATSFVEENWPKAIRQIERIKSILLDAVIRNDPMTIRAAGNALQGSQQRLSLSGDVASKEDANSVMWRLAGDVSTAALASQIRPIRAQVPNQDMARDVTELVLRAIKTNNAPMTNSELSVRLNKDPSVITRSLRILEGQGKVTFWKSGGKRYNLSADHVAVDQGKSANKKVIELGELRQSRRDFVNVVDSDQVRGVDEILLDYKNIANRRTFNNLPIG